MPNETLSHKLVVSWTTISLPLPSPPLSPSLIPHGVMVACWITYHYQPCSNLGVGISEGYFIFDFAPLPSLDPFSLTCAQKWP